ncbi:MAG: hypothetical protein M3O15_00695 [Acidobacteriota bacterium]|nr:hypothetical protein [Acidobacteriota bacterium]
MNPEDAPPTKSWLVGQAEAILDRVKDAQGFRSLTSTSQLRNMVQIVQTESEIPVLRNFIRYQTGRRATKPFWQLIHEDVLATLDQIDARCRDQAIRRAALQNFFGYLVRHYVYLNEASGAGSARPTAPAGRTRT